jgi:hypothetical protein
MMRNLRSLPIINNNTSWIKLSHAVALTVVGSAILLMFELVILPIPSELSSVPDPEESLNQPLTTFLAMLWPGLPSLLVFGVPVYRSIFAIIRPAPSNDLQRPRFIHTVSVVTWLSCASLWEIYSVIVLRNHRLKAYEEGRVHETPHGVMRGSLCQEGPFSMSRHPINFGLMWTALAYSMIDGTFIVYTCCVLFCFHLATKVIT